MSSTDAEDGIVAHSNSPSLTDPLLNNVPSFRSGQRNIPSTSAHKFSGSVTIAALCTAVVAMGPVQFGFCVSTLLNLLFHQLIISFCHFLVPFNCLVHVVHN